MNQPRPLARAAALRTPKNPVQQGSFDPPFMVLTVLYAPPGADGGHSQSSVKYSQESVLGSLVSATDLFKDETSIGVQGSSGKEELGNQVSLDVSVSTGVGESAKTSAEVKASNGAGFSLLGGSDGINHGNDQIVLLLKPKVSLTQTTQTITDEDGSKTTTRNLNWGLAADTTTRPYPISVSYLRNPQAMPPNIASQLAGFGVTPDSYAEILKADPFGESGDLAGAGPVDKVRLFAQTTRYHM